MKCIVVNFYPEIKAPSQLSYDEYSEKFLNKFLQTDI